MTEQGILRHMPEDRFTFYLKIDHAMNLDHVTVTFQHKRVPGERSIVRATTHASPDDDFSRGVGAGFGLEIRPDQRPGDYVLAEVDLVTVARVRYEMEPHDHDIRFTVVEEPRTKPKFGDYRWE